MKRLVLVFSMLILLLTAVVGCQGPSSYALQSHIDSLQTRLDSAYTPGIGEIMNGIVQPHHYKLWLAGQNENWTLAEYERHQLAGGFKRIIKYHKNSPEATALPMVYPEMDAIEKAIREKDAVAFKSHFVLLTQTCNTCHQATEYEFNLIVVPSVPAYGNQHF